MLSQLLALNHMVHRSTHGSWKSQEELKLSQPEVIADKLPRQSNPNRPSQEGQISYRGTQAGKTNKSFSGNNLLLSALTGGREEVIAISADYYRALQTQTKQHCSQHTPAMSREPK